MNKAYNVGPGQYESKYIDVCRNCSGEGKLFDCDLNSFNKRPPEDDMGTCPVCKGSGRVLVHKEIYVQVLPAKKLDEQLKKQ